MNGPLIGRFRDRGEDHGLYPPGEDDRVPDRSPAEASQTLDRAEDVGA